MADGAWADAATAAKRDHKDNPSKRQKHRANKLAHALLDGQRVHLGWEQLGRLGRVERCTTDSVAHCCSLLCVDSERRFFLGGLVWLAAGATTVAPVRCRRCRLACRRAGVCRRPGWSLPNRRSTRQIPRRPAASHGRWLLAAGCWPLAVGRWLTPFPRSTLSSHRFCCCIPSPGQVLRVAAEAMPGFTSTRTPGPAFAAQHVMAAKSTHARHPKQTPRPSQTLHTQRHQARAHPR